MTSVKQKVKDITVNKLSQSKNYINEIYSALKILLDKNYKKYDFETSINTNEIKYMTDEKFQSSLFKLNEKSKNKKIMEYIIQQMMLQDILYVIHYL